MRLVNMKKINLPAHILYFWERKNKKLFNTDLNYI